MRFTKTAISSSVAAALLATSGLTVSNIAAAEVEVAGSVAVASTYLWRGFDLGSGTPAVSGDLSVSAGGAYGGVWASSGDTFAGTEYDLFVGYGGEAGDFSYDISLWNYNYPTGIGYTDGETDFAELTDLVISLGFAGLSFTMYDNIAGNNGYAYYTLDYSYDKFNFLIGMHDDNTGVATTCPDDTTGLETCEPIHVNVSYAYNDNLSFTFSQFISDEPAGDDLKVVVAYSIPLGD